MQDMAVAFGYCVDFEAHASRHQGRREEWMNAEWRERMRGIILVSDKPRGHPVRRLDITNEAEFCLVLEADGNR